MTNPQDADSWYTVAQQHNREARHAEAIEAYTRALDLEADHVKARLGRALASHRVGKYAEAISDCTVAITRYPDWAGIWVAYYTRAGAAARVGKPSRNCLRLQRGAP